MAQFTQQAILNTFQQMLQQMPFDKITISALALQCGISPNTFYYHYRDIFDLLDAWLLRMRDQYLAKLQDGADWQAVVKMLLRDMRDHKQIVYHLVDSLACERLEKLIFESTDDTICRMLLARFAGMALPEPVVRDVVEYHSYALLGYFIQFLHRHMSDDIDKSVGRINCIYEENIWCLLKKYAGQ